MATAQEVVDAARRLTGAPYRWWDGAYPYTPGPPMYMDALEWIEKGDPYTVGYVMREGVNCTGLINWALAECGVQPVGGTQQYSEALVDWTAYDPNTEGVVGAVCLHPYEGGQGAAEGHIAMISYPDQTVIQCDGSRGVNENDYDWVTNAWAEFWWYGLLPGVDY